MSCSEPRVPRHAATSVAGVRVGRSVGRGLGAGTCVAGRVHERDVAHEVLVLLLGGGAVAHRVERSRRRSRRDLAHLQAFALRPAPQISVNLIVIAFGTSAANPRHVNA